MDEGYIKFELHWQKEVPISTYSIDDLQANRQIMYQNGLIGWDSSLKVGYGNISKRNQAIPTEFIISGSQTGSLGTLDRKHFCLVKDYDIQSNQLWCEGPIKASSESLSHAAVYQASDQYQAVIHIHHRQMWSTYYDRLPTTDPKAAYGTPEMAEAIFVLTKRKTSSQPPIIIMGGHQDGIIAFGANLDQISKVILKHLAAIQ